MTSHLITKEILIISIVPVPRHSRSRDSTSIGYVFLSMAKDNTSKMCFPFAKCPFSKQVGSLMVFWESRALQLVSLAVMRGQGSQLGLQHGAHSPLSSLIFTDQDRSWKTVQKHSSNLFLNMPELLCLALERRAELNTSASVCKIKYQSLCQQNLLLLQLQDRTQLPCFLWRQELEISTMR